ncbi:nucleoside-diphosphate kinase [Candidatus Marsarchaeota archaeon]|jgi:nucleoside-diphosphate kinase|nr:nucleoside-diphosphate kinase [Candidatus Marsarchaeota archaeon]MCL5090322.1 nucleoside-diphosphate kinase [Candidatus Marsarchaeota archaeon]
MEKSLVLIKPDGVYRALTGRIISRFEDAGFKITAMKMLIPERKLVEKHYDSLRRNDEWLNSVGSKLKGKDGISNKTERELGLTVWNQLVDYLSGKPIIAMVIEGNEVVSSIRKIVGSTEPKSAEPSSLRGSLSNDSYGLANANNRPIRNIIHASSSVSDAEEEINVWFKKEEILDYERADERIQYY